MSIQYDDKGKTFTKIVRKEVTLVRIQTPIQQIIGEIYLRRETRLKDELNKDQFLAVTNAQIHDLNGNLLHETQFLAINPAHIMWVIPESDELPKN